MIKPQASARRNDLHRLSISAENALAGSRWVGGVDQEYAASAARERYELMPRSRAAIVVAGEQDSTNQLSSPPEFTSCFWTDLTNTLFSIAFVSMIFGVSATMLFNCVRKFQTLGDFQMLEFLNQMF